MGRLLRRRAQHLGFLRVLCRDEALAEELFQELALAVLESAASYREESGDFDAWVRGIARNLWRDHLRRRRPQTRLDEAIEDAMVRAYAERSPHDAMEREEQLGRLRACLDRLSVAARDLVSGRYERGESSSVIAARTGRQAGAVDTALCRIRAALLACLEGKRA
jgi:RNA polymerase sigma-70 factor (ECF subfamily)